MPKSSQVHRLIFIFHCRKNIREEVMMMLQALKENIAGMDLLQYVVHLLMYVSL